MHWAPMDAAIGEAKDTGIDGFTIAVSDSPMTIMPRRAPVESMKAIETMSAGAIII